MIVFAVVTPAARSTPQQDDRIVVAFDPDTQLTTVTITSQDGWIGWSDILRGLARARSFDDAALEGLLPAGRFDLNNLGTRWAIVGINVALRPNVAVHRVQAEDGSSAALRIVLNRVAQLSTKRRFKEWIQRRLLRWIDRPPTRFGVRADDGWQQAPIDKPLVIVVPGLQSSAEAVEDMCTDFRRAGLPCGVFNYPNDQALSRSAELLAAELQKLAEAQPQRTVALVTHSMGGLIARAVIEDPELDPGNVSRLIMVAPPNHGSQLAQFAFALEVAEFVGALTSRKKVDRIYQQIEDGLGDASDDLAPDSPFLRALNARQRNPAVRYSIILGTGGPLSEQYLESMKERLLSEGRGNRFVRFFGAKLETALSDLDEVVAGKGDGAVAIKRGRLQGVDDVLIMDFSHLAVFVDAERESEQQLRAAILQRLTDGR